jgi:hypothetical protein
MKLWRKLTVDWPCALGDWLWATLVVAPAAFLDCLTYRSVFKMALRIGFFAVLLFYFQEIVSFDLTFLFYIDVTAYPEIAATLFVLVAAGFAGRTLGGAARFARPIVLGWSKTLLRFGTRQRRTRAMRHNAENPKAPDDEPAAAWCAGLYIPQEAISVF